MLTREQVKRLARYSYARGLDLYQQKKVISMQSEDEFQYRRIDACVKGSGRKRYEVSIAIEKETDTVAESYCECPAFYSYEGLCKHCVAVLLTYIGDQNRQAVISDFLRAQGERAAERQPGEERPDGGREIDRDVQRGAQRGGGLWVSGSGKRLTQTAVSPRTTAQLKELLQKQAVRQTLPLLQSHTYGKVRLEPLLSCSRMECTVEFRIGVAKLYVLKDRKSVV